MNFIKNTYMLIILFIITGCSIGINNIGKKRINISLLEGEQLKISLTGKTVYLVNGGDGKKPYFSLKNIFKPAIEKAIGSGLSAVTVAAEVLTDHQIKTIVEKELVSKDEALIKASELGADYMIYSVVEYWANPNSLTCSKRKNAKESKVIVYLFSSDDKQMLNKYNLQSSDCPFEINGIATSSISPKKLHKENFTTWFNQNFIK